MSEPDVATANGEAEHLAVHLGDPVTGQVVHGRDDHVGHCSLPLGVALRRHDATESRRVRATVASPGRRRGVHRPDRVAARGRGAGKPRPRTPMPRRDRRGRRHGAAGSATDGTRSPEAAHRPFGRGSGRGVIRSTSASSRVPRAGSARRASARRRRASRDLVLREVGEVAQEDDLPLAVVETREPALEIDPLVGAQEVRVGRGNVAVERTTVAVNAAARGRRSPDAARALPERRSAARDPISART